ncbi:hypothetical protein Patl1_04666 [Pistacia atlantica]|uniref:Uncharacterized protein n=1 Tax=Pistacia atlantica TaxID=434234 RepID=A0ACC1BU38_9ROSI|nr:hypothetical protein Patl1_04666 [Pistacia atlantica]
MNLSTLLSWIRTLIFSILLNACSFNFLLSSATQLSYADHCNSVVPASSITKYEHALFSYFYLRTGYYNGGNRFLSQYQSEGSHTLSFRPQRVYRTEQDGVFSIEGFLVFPSQSTYYYLGNVTTSHFGTGVLRRRRSISFSLEGFWSKSSGKLCMVGKGYIYTKEGKILNLQAVLKLSNLRNSSTTISTLVTGTMESLSISNDMSYFEPISIMILPTPRLNYEYTLVSKESGDEFSGANEIVKGLPISSLPSKSFCSIISRAVNEFNLRYTGDCDSSKNCGPFGAAVGYLPTVVSFERIQCLEKEKRMRVLVDFPSHGYEESDQPFNPNTKLVGEGLWDDKKNQLCIVACRFLNTTDSLSNAQVGDCTTKLSLGFPDIWSIRDMSYVVGKIWSNRSENDSGYFDKIMFKSSEIPFRTFPGLKYEYTKINKARSSCWPKGKPKKNKGKGYPNAYSIDMRFDMWVESSKINTSWGSATPLSVGDEFYSRYAYQARGQSSSISGSAVQANLRDNSPVNISYIISINLRSVVSWRYESLKFSAEGIYDAETGQLCMVGCRHIASMNQSSINDSKDCEVLINFQFPPSNPEMNEGYIKGSIQSTRVKSDPLYFETLFVSSVTYSAPVIRKSIKRMDLEIIIGLVTNTLACVFLGLQLFHVKKNPDVLPFISFVMLLILTLGHMFPLMLNFEALFLQNPEQKIAVLGSGGWLEVNEVLVRIITVVAVLLEVRLLQLSWSARWDGSDQVGLWFAEKSTLFMCLPLYAAGAWILSLVNWSKQRHDFSSTFFRLARPQQSLSQNWKSYAGLVSDGFLLPQILLNAFRISKENVLSSSFYFGTTFVRLLPHAYDLCRAHNYNPVGSYLYAAPNSDFYSTTWDVIIPAGGLMFAAIIFLQQWLGGQCIIPRKFREGEGYEKVPAVSESQPPDKSGPSDEKIVDAAGSDLDGNI